jgi:predicted ATPase
MSGGIIKISGFKTFSNFEVEIKNPFLVIAGPNGSGKSNFFECFCFVSSILEHGVYKALREFGGFKSIHCRKRRKEYRTTFDFSITWPIVENSEKTSTYTIKITNLDKVPHIYEKYIVNDEIVMERDGVKMKRGKFILPIETMSEILQKYQDDSLIFAAKLFLKDTEKCQIFNVLKNVKKFSINPVVARFHNKNDPDDVLNTDGGNLTSVLERIESEGGRTLEDICDVLNEVIPSFEKISVKSSDIDNSISLAISEKGYKNKFPAGLVSDGTIYLLCLLVAVYAGQIKGKGWNLIEEPERGIHPQALEKIFEIFKDVASWDNPFFVNTHSETAVRSISVDNLIFMGKVEGLTKATHPFLAEGVNIPLDEAWLSNMLNGGVLQ